MLMNLQSHKLTVWKNEKFGLTEKIFRQINSLVICLVKTLLSRNFCQKSVRLNFYNFHTVKLWFCQIFRQNNALLKKSLKNWFHAKRLMIVMITFCTPFSSLSMQWGPKFTKLIWRKILYFFTVLPLLQIFRIFFSVQWVTWCRSYFCQPTWNSTMCQKRHYASDQKSPKTCHRKS